MIYTEKANFPYPLLTNNSPDYKNSIFDFDVDLNENTNEYIFNIDYSIESEFIKNNIKSGKAKILFIIKSKDNSFFELGYNEKIIKVRKSRLSLNARTELQLMVQAKDDISYKTNDDLAEFYEDFKESIVVGKGNILGFSNVVFYDGADRNPFAIFEKRTDPNINSDIKITVGEDMILITYKSEKIQFHSHPKSRNLNNPYFYIGLQRALMLFILHNHNDGDDCVNINEIMERRNYSILDNKLIDLMISKGVSECNFYNIDEVVHKISDGIIEKYVETIGGMSSGD